MVYGFNFFVTLDTHHICLNQVRKVINHLISFAFFEDTAFPEIHKFEIDILPQKPESAAMVVDSNVNDLIIPVSFSFSLHLFDHNLVFQPHLS